MELKAFAIPMGAVRGETETSSRPHVDAQHMELAARWDAYNEPHDLKPGDFVVEKRGVGMKKPSSVILMMVWRLLDMNDPNDKLLAEQRISEYPVNRLDCIVAWLTDDSSTLVFEPHELARLQRWAPER